MKTLALNNQVPTTAPLLRWITLASVFVFLQFLAPVAEARTYYLSASGNDANSGTSTGAPWQTLTKLATQTLAPGDTVFFRRGDTFRGSLNVNNSGTATLPIVLSAYGTGDNPILSGAERITAWTLNGANYVATVQQTVSNFFINNTEQIIARYPNEGQYLFLDTASRTSLTDRDLARLTNASSLITGSQLCIHTAQWCWELETVGSFSGTTITYTNQSELDALNGYGYFLYDNITHLDTAKEWKYDATSRTLTYRAPSGINPATAVAETSVYSTGIRISRGVRHIVIQHLTFEKQAVAGVQIADSTCGNITVSRCAFNRQLHYGVESNGSQNTVEYSTFAEVDGLAMWKNQGARDVIHHNTFRNIGQFRNRGIGRQYNLSAIHLGYSDSNHVHHNVVDSAGYCGISADGTYNLIERNIVRSVMLLNNDGAALKSFGGRAAYNIFRNNFVQYSDGNTEGTNRGEFLTPGIYFDFLVSNCTVHENTIYNHTKKGIFQNAGNQNNTVTNNVVFGSNYCVDLNGTQAQPRPISGMTVKNNVFIAHDAASYLVKQSDYTNQFRQGTIDSNAYWCPTQTRFAQRYENNQPREYTFSAWQGLGNDRASRYYPPVADAAPVLRLFLNQTDDVATYSLGDTAFTDVRTGAALQRTLTLQPYTSRVLVYYTGNPFIRPITSVHVDNAANASNDELSLGVNLHVYPTVATDILTVQMSDDAGSVSFAGVFDIRGMNTGLMPVSAQGTMLVLNVGSLAQGVYMLHLQGKNGGRGTQVRFIKGL